MKRYIKFLLAVAALALGLLAAYSLGPGQAKAGCIFVEGIQVCGDDITDGMPTTPICTDATSCGADDDGSGDTGAPPSSGDTPDEPSDETSPPPPVAPPAPQPPPPPITPPAPAEPPAPVSTTPPAVPPPAPPATTAPRARPAKRGGEVRIKKTPFPPLSTTKGGAR